MVGIILARVFWKYRGVDCFITSSIIQNLRASRILFNFRKAINKLNPHFGQQQQCCTDTQSRVGDHFSVSVLQIFSFPLDIFNINTNIFIYLGVHREDKEATGLP